MEVIYFYAILFVCILENPEVKYMWKENYCIGVELIDKQHKELFDMVEKLVRSLDETADWEGAKADCKDAIEFMKRYVVTHFSIEEEYQEKIGYSDRKAHKELHDKFKHDLWLQEKILIAKNFDSDSVKQLAGLLTAWLINHVGECDQKMVSNEPKKAYVNDLTVMQAFIKSILDTLQRMTEVDTTHITGKPFGEEDLKIELLAKIDLVGDVEGSVMYGFSKAFATGTLSAMTMMNIEDIDELVCSAMAEISNIISGRTTILLEQQGYSCDITTPKLLIGTTGFVSELAYATKIMLNTPIGQMVIAATLKPQ